MEAGRLWREKNFFYIKKEDKFNTNMQVYKYKYTFFFKFFLT